MRELREILREWRRLEVEGGVGVLASVVHAEGSTYRRPGARVLVLPDERTVGLLSGGCLEGDLLLRARLVRESGEPTLVRYDGTADDVVWGLGLGCAGIVEVLLEPVDARRPGPLAWLESCLEARRRGAPGMPEDWVPGGDDRRGRSVISVSPLSPLCRIAPLAWRADAAEER